MNPGLSACKADALPLSYTPKYAWDAAAAPLPRVKSPPWHMKSVMTRWKEEPLKWSGLPERPVPVRGLYRQPRVDRYAIRTRNLQDWNLTRYRCANRSVEDKNRTPPRYVLRKHIAEIHL